MTCRRDSGPTNEPDPLADHRLTRLVGRMGLAGEDELHRALSALSSKPQQSLRIVQQQIRPLVGREAPRKAQRQCVGIEQMLRRFDLFGRARPMPPAAATAVRERIRRATCASAVRNCQSSASETQSDVASRVSASVPSQRSLPQASRPELVGFRRVPGRHVDAVGHVSDRYFGLRPAWKQRLQRCAGSPPRAGGSRR